MKINLNISSLLFFLLTVNFSAFSQAGQIDSTFGENGIVSTRIARGNEYNRGIVVQKDGKIVYGANSYANDYSGSQFLLIRYNYDGTVDKDYGQKGVVNTNFKTAKGGYGGAMNIQSDGKIIVAGNVNNTNNFSESLLAVERFNTDGSLDTTLGNKGTSTTEFKNGTASAYSVGFQTDGKIIVAGTCSFNQGLEVDFIVARYNLDGKADTSFGNGGKIITKFSNFLLSGGAVGVDIKGRIFVAGTLSNTNNNDIALVCYKPNGSLDLSFGTKGKVITDFDNSQDFGNSIAVLKDGKIVVTGSTTKDFNTPYDFALVQYNSNGSLDSSFGTDGKVTTDFGGTYDASYAMTLQQDEKIVMCGQTYDNTGAYYFSLARYNRNGSLDNTFGENGLVKTYFPNAGVVPYSIAISPDKKIVVGGDIFVYGAPDQDPLVVRYIGRDSSPTLHQTVTDLIIKSSTLKLYPNPALQSITIEGLKAAENTITVIDTKGRIVYSITTGNNICKINVELLAKGLYYVKINNSSTLKFVKE